MHADHKLLKMVLRPSSPLKQGSAIVSKSNTSNGSSQQACNRGKAERGKRRAAGSQVSKGNLLVEQPWVAISGLRGTGHVPSRNGVGDMHSVQGNGVHRSGRHSIHAGKHTQNKRSQRKQASAIHQSSSQISTLCTFKCHTQHLPFCFAAIIYGQIPLKPVCNWILAIFQITHHDKFLPLKSQRYQSSLLVNVLLCAPAAAKLAIKQAKLC